jgi:hypothetical protein
MSGSSSPIAEELYDVKSINTDLPSLVLNPKKDDELNLPPSNRARHVLLAKN